MGNLSVLMVENIQYMIRPQYQYNVISRMARGKEGGEVINKLITSEIIDNITTTLQTQHGTNMTTRNH